MQRVILVVTNTEKKSVAVSGSVAYALVITVARSTVSKFSKTRTFGLCTLYGHRVKSSSRATIKGGARYVKRSCRCEIFVLKFLCVLRRRLSLLRGLLLYTSIEKVECILVT